MKLTLPPRTGAEPLTVDSPRLTIVGANGAGKTRFARALAQSLGDRAFSLSALKALYSRDEDADPRPGSIDDLYHRAVAKSAMMRPDIYGEFDRLIALLVNEAVMGLMAERFGQRLGQSAEPSGPTRLDTVIEHWQALFPDNKILITYGKMLIDNPSGADAYPARMLSSGERAVMYYLGAALMAPPRGVIFVLSPEMFLHASVVRPLWDTIEQLRPDCTFVYITHDLGFAATRADAAMLWVKSCDSDAGTWDYDTLPAAEGLPDDVYLAILGERKPVLFIEGDGIHSYDSKIYPLIFKEYTVKPLGGCNQVIEATRSFNGLRSIHNLDAMGIVDRDRRAPAEVSYLRRRRILVPDVAEVENLFLLEEVVRTIAELNGANPQHAFGRVRRNLMRLFESNIRRQALEHTRHRIKKEVTHRVDGRFDSIAGLERHLSELLLTVNPHGIYDEILTEFRSYIASGDYQAVLRVFNHKSMIAETHVAALCGIRGDDHNRYIRRVLSLMRDNTPASERIRTALRQSFGIPDGTGTEK